MLARSTLPQSIALSIPSACVALDAGGSLLAAAHDRYVSLHNLQTRYRAWLFDPQSVRAGPIAISPDGTLLASCSRASLRMFEIKTRRLLWSRDGVYRAYFLPDWRRLAFLSRDMELCLCDAATGEHASALVKACSFPVIGFGDGGNQIAVADKQQCVVFHAPSREFMGIMKARFGPQHYLKALACLCPRHGCWLGVTDTCGMLRMTLKTTELIPTPAQRNDPFKVFADGAFFTASKRAIHVWRTDGGPHAHERIPEPPRALDIVSYAMDASALTLALCYGDSVDVHHVRY